MPGPAPRPSSVDPSWATGAKDLVMTALGPGKVWATLSHGILNEIYWPSVDQPQIRDFGFLVAGDGWWRELKRVDRYTLSVPDPVVALPTITHTGDGYQLTFQVVVDPERDALLVQYELSGDGVRLYPLIAAHMGTTQQNTGADNYAWIDPSDHTLFASVANRSVCVLASGGFTRASAGYVGDSDGWTDFARNGSMTWTYSQAGPGFVAVMGELAAPEGLLGMGFATTSDQARAVAQASLSAGFLNASQAYTAGWQSWAAALKLPGTAQGLTQEVADAVRQSAAVLRIHEDHATPGAFVAGLATPWGQDTNDPGGYHMVWCRDGTESGLALAAAGHADDARALLAYLASCQKSDGHWPRCFFVDGTFDPNAAVQLDETAFPVLLAGRLEQDGVPLPPGTDDMIRKAAQYLAQAGPISGVDLWEENAGGSAFTIGLEIAALVVAASRLSGDEQQYALDLADNWNERLEQFTYVAGSELDQYFGTDGHYVRIGPTVDSIKLANQPSGAADVPAEALVGMEFLYLPRLGLRAASDKRITDTLKIVEAMIGVDTPSGRTYHRYDLDGYGEWLDGSGWPVRNFGIGRPWPLLAGERGHYEVLAGGNAATQLTAMVNMRGRGGLLPEQIWDANPIPWHDLQPGKPTGSAMPLAWAHSELIKLAVTATTGQPVEMLQRVVDRYHASIPASKRWFWRDAAPVLELPPGLTLVVEDPQPFTLHFGFDEWNGVTELASQPLGLGMQGAVVEPGSLAGHRTLQFVRRYADGRWERRSRNDVSLNVPLVAALRLSSAEQGRIASVRG